MAFLKFFNATVSDLRLDGKTIVIPIVSTANVGQLAVDLFIATLGLDRIGVFHPRFFIPVVGEREDGRQGITTPCELYGHPDHPLVFVQQRSPALKERKIDFIFALLRFIKSSQISAVLWLSGVDPLHRTDSQMLASTFQIQLPIVTQQFVGTPLHNLLNLPIPSYTPVQHDLYLDPESVQPSLQIPFIPGGGITGLMLYVISTHEPEWDIPVATLVHFAMEGDNRADADLFASVVAKVLGLEVSEWKQPSSWQVGLFGTPHEQSLYG